MNKSIAFVGGGGFIGTNLTNFFVKLDYHVLVIGRSIKVDLPNDVNKITRKILDVNKTSKLIDNLHEYENIVWLVNNLVPSDSMDSLSDDFNYNISPLIHFLESAYQLQKLKRFIFLSSGGTIYGDSPSKTIFKENDLKNPISAYGLSKIIAEYHIGFISQRSTFKSIILRPSNVYGNFQNLKKPQGIVGYAFKALIDKTPLSLYGNGTVIRDFIHVLDLAEALKCCIENKNNIDKVQTYNVGSQEGHTVKEVLEYINEISGLSIQTFSLPARSFDCNYNVLDITKITSELGWEPKIKIKEGLSKVWHWINSESVEL